MRILHWLLRLCEMWWVAVVSIVSSVITTIIAIPIASGFDDINVRIGAQFGAFLHFATSHSGTSSLVLLAMAVPTTIGFFWSTFKNQKDAGGGRPGDPDVYKYLLRDPDLPQRHKVYSRNPGLGNYMAVQGLGIGSLLTILPLTVMGGIFIVPSMVAVVVLSSVASLIGIVRAAWQKQWIWVPIAILVFLAVFIVLFRLLGAANRESQPA